MTKRKRGLGKKILLGILGLGLLGALLDDKPASEPKASATAPPIEAATSEPKPNKVTLKDIYSAELEALDAALRGNKLGVQIEEAEVRENPTGAGAFIFLERTRFAGVERKILWFANKRISSPLNGASKGLTPTLKFPRELPTAFLEGTGHDPIGITSFGLDLVFR